MIETLYGTMAIELPKWIDKVPQSLSEGDNFSSFAPVVECAPRYAKSLDKLSSPDDFTLDPVSCFIIDGDRIQKPAALCG